jgi:hypothetical protein
LEGYRGLYQDIKMEMKTLTPASKLSELEQVPQDETINVDILMGGKPWKRPL